MSISERITALFVWVSSRLQPEDEGATAVEYGIMVALIAAVIITVVALLGQEIKATFQKVVTCLTGGGC